MPDHHHECIAFKAAALCTLFVLFLSVLRLAATRAPRSFSYPKGLLTVTARADVTVLPVTGQISRLPSGHSALAFTRAACLHALPF